MDNRIPFNDPEEFDRQYAEYLAERMERQYWDELEAQYEGAVNEAHTISEEYMEEEMKYSDDLAHQLLHLPMQDNDAGAATVGEYLGLLLSTLWLQKDGFSGKRPFGNSSWEMEVYIAMNKAGMCELELDEDGYVDTFTQEAEIAADELILQAIRLMYNHG